jgi:predicted unusual protein kinase regulating ubiquinone biosynthesis (AarF/ABC1/UbiB family)
LDRRQGELYIAKARKFRDTAAEMGGLLIKLGQFFSSRVDILPASVIKELEGLQDDVQAESFADMEKIIADEFHSSPDSIFASI